MAGGVPAPLRHTTLSHGSLGIRLKNVVVGTKSCAGAEGTEGRMLKSSSLSKCLVVEPKPYL